jgi:hypothetical protein
MYGVVPPETLLEDHAPRVAENRRAAMLAETRRVIESLGSV